MKHLQDTAAIHPRFVQEKGRKPDFKIMLLYNQFWTNFGNRADHTMWNYSARSINNVESLYFITNTYKLENKFSELILDLYVAEARASRFRLTGPL